MKRPACLPASSGINDFTEDGTSSTLKLPAPVDGLERVNPGDEEISDEELCRRMSLIF